MKRNVSFQVYIVKTKSNFMIFYDFDGKRLVDVQTLIEQTNFNKTKLLRLLKKTKVDHIRYQNRNIYFISEIIDKIGIKFE
jgi:hypothetical protein